MPIKTKYSYGRYHEDDYIYFVKGKKVVLVGPSETLIGSNQGNYIDSFDIIVRLNLSCPVPQILYEDVGSRTDVLYHVLIRTLHIKKASHMFKYYNKKDVTAWKEDGVKWVVSKTDAHTMRVKTFAPVINGVIPWITIPLSKLRGINTEVGCAPNLGVITINHLLQNGVKDLYVTGCDFHMSGYYEGYGGFNKQQAKLGIGAPGCWGQSNSKERIHALEPQLQYLNKLLKSDKRFKPDQILLNLIKEVG